MHWTPERAILAHPLDAHALVHAVPGAGKTTTLVGRVTELHAQGLDPRRLRVVMFNKAIQETFAARLAAAGVDGVKVTTFDALGLEVLRVAERRGLLTRPLEVAAHRSRDWAHAVHRKYHRTIDSPDDLAAAVFFWKAHLVPPARAACVEQPQLVDAYRDFEALRAAGPRLQIDFPDMVYTAVGVLRKHPRLLGAIDHFLIDEFQDINPARVALLRGLMHDRTTVTAVGDADQAIYEWSGAHPKFFREFASTFAGLPARNYTLSHSFRFGPTIAAAASSLIAHNTDRAPLVVVGEGPHPGRIDRIDDVPGALAALLADAHAPRDLAVLYRGRTQGVAVLAELAARRIAMETEDIDQLRRGRGPELALAYLHFATSDAPVDFDAAWNLAYAPDRYIRKESFHKQIQQLGQRGLRAVLKDSKLARRCEQPAGAIDTMAALADLLHRMGRCRSAGQALDLLTREEDIEALLAARKRSDVELEQSVATFHAVHVLLHGLGVAPTDAARALTELDPRAGQPPEQCVWVSTIHRAKGKEWRAVLLPRLAEGLCPAGQRGQVPGTVDHPHGIDQSDWAEQERRIFYVGLTRARERVCLEIPEQSPSSYIEELALERRPVDRDPRASPAGKPKHRPRPDSDVTGLAARNKPAAPDESARPAFRRNAPAEADERPSVRKPWRPADDEALAAAWAAREDLAGLAARFGRSPTAIAARLVQLGVVATRDAARQRPLARSSA
ncbi:ATP-dependent helicase [Nannocystis sp.]|uniref:UvrD-helicase domain-containing protein n=1 Tax=Nannocystis sp. TaxID=1962667 RepID=UPI0025F20124|nr:ATP-dependent helicase [Nannocystis sp.]MBK7830728.1 ATP-dependent helicase [Nannocystis sp.]